jgi:hypothetical protein
MDRHRMNSNLVSQSQNNGVAEVPPGTLRTNCQHPPAHQGVRLAMSSLLAIKA